MNKKIEVCLIDDQPEAAAGYKKALEAGNDIKVNLATSESKLTDILSKGIAPEAVLCIDERLDHWQMGSGIDLARKFSERWVHTPVIVYSNYLKNFDEAMEAGAWYYVSVETMNDAAHFPMILRNCIIRGASQISLKMLQDAIDGMPVEIMIVDQDYSIVLANRKKKLLRGEKIEGRQCYRCFHDRKMACDPCPVKKVIEERVSAAEEEGWVHPGTWNEQAQRMIDKEYFCLTAYAIETPRGRLIAEVADCRTEQQVRFELSRDIIGADTYEKIAELSLKALKDLGYVRGRIYIFNDEQTGVALARSFGMPKSVTEPKLQKIGIKFMAQWIGEEKDVDVFKWTRDRVDSMPELRHFGLKIGVDVIRALIRVGGNEGGRLLGALTTDREGDARNFSDGDQKTLGALTFILANAIENVHSITRKARDAGERKRHSKILREFLETLASLNKGPDIIRGLAESCGTVAPDSCVYYSRYDTRRKTLLLEARHNSQALAGPKPEQLEARFGISGRAFEEERIIHECRLRSTNPIGKLLNLPDDETAKLFYSSIGSFLAIPVSFKEDKCGVLVVARASEMAYDELQVETLVTLANAAAMDLANASRTSTLQEAMTEWHSLGILHKYVGREDTIGDMIAHCLAFLTVEAGLGFHRALYLTYDSDARCYRFTKGKGAFDKEEFTRICREIKDEEFEELIRKAPEAKDGKLNERLAGLAIDETCKTLWRLLHLSKASTVDSFMDAKLLESRDVKKLHDAINMGYFLIARVDQDNAPVGCLVVDKRFVDHPFADKDIEFLQVFASEMGRILESHGLRLHIMKQHHLSTLGWMASAIGHELNTPCSDIDNRVWLIGKYIKEKRYDDAMEQASKLNEAKTKVVDTIRALRGVVKAGVWTNIEPGTVLRECKTLYRERLVERRIRLVENVEVSLPRIDADLQLLQMAFVNLVRNSVDSIVERLDSGVEFQPEIEVSCFREDDSIVFRVKDNGNGIEPEVMAKIRQTGSVVTTKPSRGLGFGLHVVRESVAQHGGRFEIESISKEGTTARMVIPISKGDNNEDQDSTR